MQLTDEQIKAIDIAVDRYKNQKKYMVISGWAGCGKSTIIKYIIAALPDIDPETDVVYSAITGKACEVMKRKGNSNVSTLHKLLYKTILLPNGSYKRIVKDSIEFKVVIVDECSMVPKDMLEILGRLAPFVIFLGDDAQLPPIYKEDDNHLLDNPHIRLTKIMRQEEGNGIIDVATAIREGRPFYHMSSNDVKILDKKDLNEGMLEWADIIICATNATRRSLNQSVRRVKGMEGEIAEGEKIICLRNDWDTLGDNDSPLINGTIGYATNIFPTKIYLPSVYGGTADMYNLTFTSEVNEEYSNLTIDKSMFISEVPFVDNKTKYKIMHSRFKDSIPNEFTYGYCITAHKAQGSQWNKVLVYEEGFPFVKEEHKRWLYTACTRAIDKLVILH